MIFEEKCSSCHTIGGGDGIGPDLEGVTDRQDRDLLVPFIVAPDEVRPGVAMPNLGLTEEQAEAVLAFIETQSEGAAQEPPPSEEAPPPEQAPSEPSAEEPEPIAAPGEGDPASGEDLFRGVERFTNGGTPCLSCHTLAGLEPLAGGTLGPDLTSAYDRFGEGLLGFLAVNPMGPIYDDQPLTAGEEADLTAFLAQVTGEEEAGDQAWKFALIALGAAALLMVAIGFIWRDRLISVRKVLVRNSSRGR